MQRFKALSNPKEVRKHKWNQPRLVGVGLWGEDLMGRSISIGQKRRLKMLLGQVVEEVSSELTYDCVKQFIDDGGSGLWFVKDGVKSLLLTHIRPPSRPSAPALIAASAPEVLWRREIEVGNYKSSEEMEADLIAKGLKIGNWASDILPKVRVEPTPGKVMLVATTVSRLVSPEGSDWEHAHAAGLELGWELCHDEDGAQLLRQHGDKLAMNEWWLMAMPPIVGSSGCPYSFDVERNPNGRWLKADVGTPGRCLEDDDVVVFRCKSL